jgi:phenylalanyl-tRNA synthetase beta chain
VKGFVEEERACFALTGASEPLQWKIANQPFTLFDMKGEVLRLLRLAGLDKSELISYSSGVGLIYQALAIEINNGYAGYLGRVRSDVVQRFGIEGEIFVAEIVVGRLERKSEKTFEPLAKFPKVTRDLALIVQKGMAVGEVEKSIRETAGPLLKSITLFDVYVGENVPPDTKSLAFALEFQSPEKTLTDGEIEREMQRIIDTAARALGATIRGS